MSDFRFTISHKDNKTQARTGVITTRYGTIRTPAFVPVGTAASVKSLTPQEIKDANIDVFFVNTYHMLFRPGIEVVKKSGGLHTFMDWDGPIMTDSAGFQAFSLGEFGPRNSQPYNHPGGGRMDSPRVKGSAERLVKINKDGIEFKSVWDGTSVFLGPKQSIEAQINLDADIMMAFDECTFYPISPKRAKLAMERTHRWLLTCIETKNKHMNTGALYGIVQGSVFENLRKISAQFVASHNIEGLAIGSVANSKEPREKVFAVLDWTMPTLLTTKKPIHFLGIGEVEDIFLSIERGIDTLDCITPTRLARMGWIFDKKEGLKNKFRYDIVKAKFAGDTNPPVRNCRCFTCQHYSRAYLNHLFRSRELLSYRLATIHNLTFFGDLMEEIRESISNNQFLKLKDVWLNL